jgi:hypothetical protein
MDDTSGAQYTGWVKIALAYWRQPTTAGHLLLLNDADGRPIIDARCESNNASQVFRLKGMWYHGLTLATRQSGVLHLHIL